MGSTIPPRGSSSSRTRPTIEIFIFMDRSCDRSNALSQSRSRGGRGHEGDEDLLVRRPCPPPQNPRFRWKLRLLFLVHFLPFPVDSLRRGAAVSVPTPAARFRQAVAETRREHPLAIPDVVRPEDHSHDPPRPPWAACNRGPRLQDFCAEDASLCDDDVRGRDPPRRSPAVFDSLCARRQRPFRCLTWQDFRFEAEV